jgi:RNA polymerase sigma factor (TIGR02999 family)
MRETATPDAPLTHNDALFASVYDRLKAMASRRLTARERGAALDTTALVHELYLRINTRGDLVFEHPAKFFDYAARAMRHLLIDHARERLSQRAGGDWVQVTLTGSDDRLTIESAEQAIAMDASIRRLEAIDARAARVVELHFFAGLSSEQTAEALGISRRTATRDLQFATAFLRTDLG